MSSGDIVPDVMTTLLNLSNTGLMARAGSRQLHDDDSDEKKLSSGRL